ncbi:UNVERIFIED_CONTAM: hypothetical protein Slati_2941200 [Sesamum latifolium]|uniref:Uncharacterized protein n=1 Tax=Sesamum latifolium TaxID=2727402 RepID=A0AAW2VFB8_9LAMI
MDAHKTLSSLSHNTYTPDTLFHTSNPTEEDDGGLDDAKEAAPTPSVGVAPEDELIRRVVQEFNFQNFYVLANRVAHGNSESLATLNSLKTIWEKEVWRPSWRSQQVYPV